MKSYKLRLTVETPVHIGTGESYYDLEYTVKGGRFYIIDKDKFFNRLEKLGKIDLFTKLAAKGDISSIIAIRKLVHDSFKKEDSLSNFEIDKSALPEIEKKMFNFTNIERHKSGEIRKILNQMKISKTYKNPLSLEPVIPGSSIKGAIRTAIIRWLLSKDEKTIESIAKKPVEKRNIGLISVLRKFQKDITPDTVKDLLRFIKVSDFSPVNSTIKIGKAKMVHRKNRKKRETGLPAYLEYVSEKSIFEGTITIDCEMAESIFGKEKNFKQELLSIQNIMKVLRIRYGTHTYYYGEKKYFGNFINWKLRPKKHDMEAPIKIGFHSGSLAVTTGIPEITRIPNKGGKSKDKPLPPLTLWTINKKPMGWCYLEVVE
ncbi:type III-A CRISPR-associated RAMP protein Csm5 [Desulfurobacterium indicum]|uniref:CRISPR system Cms protein Csm5 n=1 Tax=Desulfurobacterium indicum TaxID=1914305 RepID=A0A1R1MKQ9_9BACT|nr:type III-A CRISPR-associated RAMP protein Csm5 [Desulfurobacterium indicum]OMH40392.1 type III-A CRISPR-associated RAMP protein Csm5 [Desulfurobacterium indicum]